MNWAVNTSELNLWTKYDQLSDRRTRGWFMVDSPVDVTLLAFGYLAMVWIGPKLMEKRKAFKFKGLLIAYNFFLVLLNVYIVKEIVVSTSRLNYAYLCHPSKGDYHPDEMRVLTASWLYYTSKFLEFIDTLFFILRKKNDQISLLHVYHHSTMVFFCWVYTKWFPGGAIIRLPMINSMVHVIMYLYYGLCAMGPSVRKHLWWKRYITQIQLVQFVISMLWAAYSLWAGCNHPAWIDVTNILYMGSFLFLFGNFYKNKYKIGRQEKEKLKSQ